MIALKIIFIIVALVIVVIALMAAKVAYNVAHPRTFTLDEIYTWEKQKDLIFDYESLEKEEFIVVSYDGYRLNGYYFKNTSNKFIIFTHGYTSNRFQSLKYLDIFYKLGYNCIIYDDRGHGVNKKSPITMGYWESKDLIKVVQETYNRFGDDIYLGLHGESMGSGIQINALRHLPNIKFVVNDCGYGVFKDVLKDQIKHAHLPRFIAYPAGIVSKILYGYNMCKLKPVDSLWKNTVPICFIHGDSDKFTNKIQSKIMYDATKGYKELHYFKDADHAMSFEMCQNEYRNVVQSFLVKIQEKGDLI